MKSIAIAAILSIALFSSCSKDGNLTDHHSQDSDPTNQEEVQKNLKSITYLNFSIDPMVPGGLTTAQITAYVNEGWTETYFSEEYEGTSNFLNSAGQEYQLTGYIKTTDPILFNPTSDELLSVACGNTIVVHNDSLGIDGRGYVIVY